MQMANERILWGAVAALAISGAVGGLWWRHLHVPSQTQAGTVIAGEGKATVGGQPAMVGAAFDLPSAVLETGPDGVLSVRLEDGSVVQLGPNSRLEVLRALKSRSEGEFETELKLDAGEIQRNIPSGDGVQRLSSVRDGRVAIGVRGTVFLVRVGEAGTAVMVHRGAVGLDGAGAKGLPLEAGQGTIATDTGIEAPTPLPPAPTVLGPQGADAWTARAVRFAWQPVEGATGYVLEVASDPAFDGLVARVATGAVSQAELALPRDGSFHWRVATLDARGLQGAGSAGLPLIYKAHHATVTAAAQGRLPEAEGVAAETGALAGFPDDEVLLRDIARLHARQGDHSGAIAFYDQAIEQAPDDAAALVERGRVRFALKDYAAADADFVAALARDAKSADAAWGRADVALASRDARNAFAHASAALSLDRDHVGAPMTAARAAVALERVPEAITVLERHLGYHPRDRAAREYLAGLIPKPVAAAPPPPAPKAEPKSPEVWRDLAWARRHAGDYAGALAAYDRAVNLDPTDELSLLERGEYRVERGDAAGGLADIEAAIAAAPQSGDPRAARARVRMTGGDAAGALSDAQFALAAPGGPIAVALTAAQAAHQLGQTRTAKRHLVEYLRHHPDDAEALSLARTLGLR
jgi:tetratricopeptide (TPR) repeat protein